MFEQLLLGQYIPVDSFLHRLDARAKVVVTLLLGIVIFKVKQPGFLLITILLLTALLISSRVGVRYYWQGIRPFRFLIIITLSLLALLTPGTVWWSFKLINITYQGLQAAALLGVKIILILLLMNLLTATTSPVALMDGLERIGKPLLKLGFPLHELIMIMTISLRFLPLLMGEAVRIYQAQHARGASLKRGGLQARLTALMAILFPLIRHFLHRADLLVEAMESRGYQGGNKRTSLHDSPLVGADYFYMAGIGSISLVLLFWGK